MWRIIIITDLVFGEVYRVSIGIDGRNSQNEWQLLGNYYCACVVIRRHSRTCQPYGMTAVCPSPTLPTVQSARVY